MQLNADDTDKYDRHRFITIQKLLGKLLKCIIKAKIFQTIKILFNHNHPRYQRSIQY